MTAGLRAVLICSKVLLSLLLMEPVFSEAGFTGVKLDLDLDHRTQDFTTASGYL